MAHTTNAEEDGCETHTRRSEKPCCKAIVPLHVTGFWVPIIADDPLKTGSLGAGLLLEASARGYVFKGRGGIRLVLSNIDASIPTVNYAIEEIAKHCRLDSMEIVLEADRPLGAGYAVSAALTLAATLAAACYCSLPLDLAARIAHEAEVVNGTGLGDVIAVFEGRMLEVRVKPGAPGVGRVVSIPFPVDTIISTAVRRMETKTIHRTMARRVAVEGLKAYTRFVETMQPEDFLQQAHDFSIKLGFVDRDTAEKMDKAVRRGILIGWYLKKGVLIAVPEKGLLEEAIDYVKSLGIGKTYVERVAGKPAGVSWCDEDTEKPS